MARNLAAIEASNDFLLMLDDDSYPLPGAIETLTQALEDDPRLAVAAGLVRDVDLERGTEKERGDDTFDYWLGRGQGEDVPESGLPSFFFAEGASMVRREAFLEVGGFFEPFFHACVGLDIRHRAAWPRLGCPLLPLGPFRPLQDRRRSRQDQDAAPPCAEPALVLLPPLPGKRGRAPYPAYLLFDLLESAKSGALRPWTRGVHDAWRERASVQGTREPLPREVIRRAELNRGRLHLRLVALRAARLARQLRPRSTL